jgi:translocation and assembly module TamA
MKGIMRLQLILSLTFLMLAYTSRVAFADPVEVVIEGVEGDLLENVKAALSLPPGIVEDGKVNRLWLDRFADQAEERAVNALKPFGYYSASLSTSLDETDEGEYRLHVKIEPGEPVRVKDVSIRLEGPGKDKPVLVEMVSTFPVTTGDVLHQMEYEKAKGAIKFRAIELGYLDSDYITHEIRISLAEKSADISLVLDTGPRYRFGEVTFTGAGDYPDGYLRRFVAFRKGEVFSYAKLGKTQLNLANSDRFKSVIVSPQKEKTEDYEVPIVVKLEEAPSRRLRPGIGYGTDTGARLSVKYRDLNVFGRGREFNSELNLSEKLRGLSLGYIIPDRGSIQSQTEVLLNAIDEDVDRYRSRRISAEINRTRSFRRGRLGTVYLRILLEDFTVGSGQSDAFLVIPGIRFSQRRYDDVVRPRKGFNYSAEIRGSHQVLGSDTGFLQTILEGGTIISLPADLIFYTRFRGAITFQNEPLRDLPASLRFFTGGDRSVRGYSYQSLGPRDSEGEVVGGKNLLVGSVELEKPLFKNWGVAVFYDAGNAFNSLSDINLFQGAGIGGRYYTKIGTVRLDIARQIDVANPDFRIHLTVGVGL